MGDLTAHFSKYEFACKDGTEVPAHLLPNLMRLCNALEVLRADLGQPITIMSGYRTAAYNAKCGGAKFSRHVQGDAADIQVAGVAPDVVADAVVRLMKQGKIGPGGVGRYDAWTHLDMRGTNARWDFRKTGRRG